MFSSVEKSKMAKFKGCNSIEEFEKLLRQSFKPDYLKLVKEDLFKDREIWAFLLKGEKTYLFKYLPDFLKEDKGFVLLAVTKYGLNLQHVAKSLKSDGDIILRALTQNGNAFQHVPEIGRAHV